MYLGDTLVAGQSEVFSVASTGPFSLQQHSATTADALPPIDVVMVWLSEDGSTVVMALHEADESLPSSPPPGDLALWAVPADGSARPSRSSA